MRLRLSDGKDKPRKLACRASDNDKYGDDFNQAVHISSSGSFVFVTFDDEANGRLAPFFGDSWAEFLAIELTCNGTMAQALLPPLYNQLQSVLFFWVFKQPAVDHAIAVGRGPSALCSWLRSRLQLAV